MKVVHQNMLRMTPQSKVSLEQTGVKYNNKMYDRGSSPAGPIEFKKIQTSLIFPQLFDITPFQDILHQHRQLQQRLVPEACVASSVSHQLSRSKVSKVSKLSEHSVTSRDKKQPASKYSSSRYKEYENAYCHECEQLEPLAFSDCYKSQCSDCSCSSSDDYQMSHQRDKKVPQSSKKSYSLTNNRIKPSQSPSTVNIIKQTFKSRPSISNKQNRMRAYNFLKGGPQLLSSSKLIRPESEKRNHSRIIDQPILIQSKLQRPESDRRYQSKIIQPSFQKFQRPQSDKRHQSRMIEQPQLSQSNLQRPKSDKAYHSIRVDPPLLSTSKLQGQENVSAYQSRKSKHVKDDILQILSLNPHIAKISQDAMNVQEQVKVAVQCILKVLQQKSQVADKIFQKELRTRFTSTKDLMPQQKEHKHSYNWGMDQPTILDSKQKKEIFNIKYSEILENAKKAPTKSIRENKGYKSKEDISKDHKLRLVLQLKSREKTFLRKYSKDLSHLSAKEKSRLENYSQEKIKDSQQKLYDKMLLSNKLKKLEDDRKKIIHDMPRKQFLPSYEKIEQAFVCLDGNQIATERQ